MTSKFKEKWWHSLTVCMAMSIPAIRSVVVSAWAWIDESGTMDTGIRVYPVISILAETTNSYWKFRQSYKDFRPPIFTNHSDMIDNGWKEDASQGGVELSPVIFYEDYKEFIPLNARSGILDGVNEVYEIVVCDWPQNEDSVNLGPTIRDLQQRAIAKETANKTLKPAP